MRPGEPCISCSLTLITLSSSVCAEAAGYTAETTIEGGATGGYCDTGSCVTATEPPTMMNRAMTHAKIGRSMKNVDMDRSPCRCQRAAVAAAEADGAPAPAADAAPDAAGCHGTGLTTAPGPRSFWKPSTI